jgi:molybdenum cofactor guanylyltransferase
MLPALPSFSAALIAGGKSRRMGTDKCLLAHPTVPNINLWQHQWHTLQQLGAQEMYISGRAEQTYFPSHQVVIDEWPDSGPLGGIASVMRRMQTPLLVVLGVDLPHITEEILRTLLSASAEREANAKPEESGAVFHSGNYYEPLVAVYPQRLLASAVELLEQQENRLQTWVQQAVANRRMRSLALPAAWREAFLNMNELDGGRIS